MSERKPLTLEVMRRMVIDDIDCMAFVVVHDIKGDFDVAAVLDEVFGDGICAAYSVGPVEYKEKDYGKTWVAYAAEPPRLDRSSWAPCECCRSAKFMNGNAMYKFCPDCGRPMTVAAWDMWERRMAGHENQ